MKEAFETVALTDPDILDRVKQGFHIDRLLEEEQALIVRPKEGHQESFNRVLKNLQPLDLYPVYRREKDGLTLRVVKRKNRKKELSPHVHSALIIATLFTVTMAGYIWWAAGDLFKSVLFTLGLMGILGGHELGHALVARKNRVDATLPFFLPVPPFFAFGTLGAVIFINSPIPDRRSLFDIGVAGPLTGFILSIPVLVTGISLSTYAYFEPAKAALPFQLGTPLLFNILAYIILGPPGPRHVINPHPLAVAGWAGLFVTALNLLPMGQLDGGHVVRAVFPKGFKTLYRSVFWVLFTIGGFGMMAEISGVTPLLRLFWPGWLFWAALVYLMTRLEHPGPLNDVTHLDRGRKTASIGVLLIFLLSFIPVPVVPI
ncbi:MAG: site-2 protease family protein [Methanobacteriota archaeon]|nr:MAG: site-2 protease family protein [Euryarchaeota archaeon]